MKTFISDPYTEILKKTRGVWNKRVIIKSKNHNPLLDKIHLHNLILIASDCLNRTLVSYHKYVKNNKKEAAFLKNLTELDDAFLELESFCSIYLISYTFKG